MYSGMKRKGLVMEKQKVAIGIDDFAKLRLENYYYVDKTMLIHDLLTQSAEVSLFTRPRRFGKTLNMTMVREFFDCTKDSHTMFDDLQIARTESYQQLNQHPTLYFSFKDCKGDKKEVLAGIFNMLLQAFDQYEFLVESLSVVKQKQYEQMVDVLLYKQTEHMELVGDAILYLCSLLADYYKAPVVLILDEYDTPLESAYVGGYYEQVHHFISNLYASALKGNPYLKMGVLTGIQRIGKENIFSGLNNLKVYTLLDHKYSQYFGLTEVETKKLLEDQGMNLNDEVKAMYNGYNFGGTYVYNPWSVLNYVEDKELLPYWVNTASNKMIKEILLKHKDSLDFCNAFETLMVANHAEVFLNTNTTYSEESSVESLWALLLHAGYITVKDQVQDEEALLTIRIPNKEVRKAFKGMIADYTRIKESSLRLMFEYLIQRKDIEAFRQVYQQMVYSSTSYYDAKENAYHMLFLGMCMFLDGYYKISSNIETGNGRADILLEALKPGYQHLIIEFKQGENLEKLLVEAITQMEEKNYAANLKGSILLLGIAHNKKKCEVKSKEITF